MTAFIFSSSLVERKRLNEADLAFELISEHDRRKSLKIGSASARLIALASAEPGEHVVIPQILRKVLRRRVGRADKYNVSAEI